MMTPAGVRSGKRLETQSGIVIGLSCFGLRCGGGLASWQRQRFEPRGDVWRISCLPVAQRCTVAKLIPSSRAKPRSDQSSAARHARKRLASIMAVTSGGRSASARS